MSYEASGLETNKPYEFWVTASTNIGEGQQSKSIIAIPSDKVPAKVASFDDTFVATFKEDAKLPCLAVGSPTPNITWKVCDSILLNLYPSHTSIFNHCRTIAFTFAQVKGADFMPNERIRILAQGTLFIKEVIRQDAGDYECIAENSIAKDSITHKLTVLGLYSLFNHHNWLRFNISMRFFILPTISSSSIASGDTYRDNNWFTHSKIEATWHGLGPHTRLYIALQARIRWLGNGWSGCRCSKVHDRKFIMWITIPSVCHWIQQVR